MWAIIKFNKKNFNLMKKELIARNDSLTSFYQPLIKVQKQNKNKLFFKELPLLGNYIFCYNKNFSNQNFITSLKNIKGIEYILKGYIASQVDIKKFIERCKQSQNNEGFLSYKFYDLVINKNYRLTTGPFTNSIFQIISIQKNKIDLAVNNFKISLKKNKLNLKTA